MSSGAFVAAGVSTLGQVFLRSLEVQLAFGDTSGRILRSEAVWWLIFKPLSFISLASADGNVSLLFLSAVMFTISEILLPSSTNSDIGTVDFFFNVIGWILLLFGVISGLSTMRNLDNRDRLARNPRVNDYRYDTQL